MSWGHNSYYGNKSTCPGEETVTMETRAHVLGRKQLLWKQEHMSWGGNSYYGIQETATLQITTLIDGLIEEHYPEALLGTNA